ncbi:MAG TPA: hypothetical protein VGN64_14310 [Dyadobacter sp.]|jgi:lipid II:glycine glycyltransferase (peptidoglycan interpeptide bridge formation enzyme)|nr:hypothetical protein [Dyadobacter sp.]
MLTAHVNPGQFVNVETIGSNDQNKAPSLNFYGILESENTGHFQHGCIQIKYNGQIAVWDGDVIIGYKSGEKTMTIPRKIVKSVSQVEKVLK